MRIVSIEELPRHVGERVQVNGWLTGLRSSGKIAFLQLRDGSGYVQGVLVKSEVDEATFELARSLPQESAVAVTGEVRADTRSQNGVELGLDSVALIGRSGDYPITPKEHGVDFLFEHRHLYLRHKAPWAMLRVRDEIERGIHDFFSDRGFLRFDAPFFMPTAVEGTTNLFEIALFDEGSAYLSQSGQLYAEAGAMALGKVYTFGPTFRAEKSKTRRHLLEFWMVEPEVAYLEHEGNMQLQEDMVAYLVGRVLDKRRAELELLGRDVAKLEPSANGDFPRITYDEALAYLATKGEVLQFGDDFGAPHETMLGERYDRPVFVEKWPTAAKAFYMQPVAGDPTRVLAADLIGPEGYGELIGGSQRIHDLDLLLRRIREHDLPEEAFGWYLDLRRFGSVPHSGFGMGLERFLAWVTGAHHLREVIPFPRMLTRIYP
ncbi:MAG: asparagine--tRNA ligase [Trueperaceae bacterium]|nr:asparagine--tRNA ligase [Trueperaceae bacterium]MCO5174460.1 asparagine--tRNA ligase [Trueperaceae bacterium]MCW5819833.1 asparagine--tRNA ligase [Trueperaceae bacterium]